MGYATIVSGGDAGRYTITMDFGEATRQALLAALSLLLVEIDVKIAAAQTKVNDAEAKEAAAEAAYQAAVQDFIDLHANFVPGSPRPDDSAVLFTLKRLRDLQLAHQPLRVNLSAVKLDKAIALKRVAYWNTVVTTNTRQAWCTDYTEDAAPGQVVATMEIPGDDNLIVIAAGARAWTEADGYLAARELMSPEQAYFNAAIFPGWQIDRPTYRWGTVTAVDPVGNTLDVVLEPATSSAQRLNINRETALAAVPVNYMDTGSVVFLEGDRVVVQFQGQAWDAPRVTGFLDNPRPVGLWQAMIVGVGSAGGDDYTLLYLRVRPGAEPTLETIFAAAVAGTLAGSYRVNRGGWQPLDRHVLLSGDIVTYTFEGESPGFGFDLLALYASDSSGGGFSLLLDAREGMGFVPGDIVEARLLLDSEVIFNAAVVCRPTGTAPVALIGQLLNEFGIDESSLPFDFVPMVRLTYTLFQTGGT